MPLVISRTFGCTGLGKLSKIKTTKHMEFSICWLTPHPGLLYVGAINSGGKCNIGRSLELLVHDSCNMALLESVSGFRELFTDPPEFEILHVSQRQQISNFIRIILGGMALLLLAIQSSAGPISCTFIQNSTLSKGSFQK